MYACPVSLGANVIDQMSPKELKVAQDLDPVIGPVKQAFKSSRLPVQSPRNPDVALLSRESTKLELKDGLL